MSESTEKHKEHALKSLTFAIVTVSSSRYQQLNEGGRVDDVSGDLAESLLKKAGHRIMLRKTISDERAMIEECVCSALFTEGLDATIFCGGTGIAPSDMTIETVSPFLEKALQGFGEIFRRLSFDQIGSAALMSRAIAGVAKGKVVFCIPGSPDAVRLCVERLILPETAHIVKHARE